MAGNHDLIDLPYTSERVPTGVPGLDEILCGGLLRGRLALVKGTPGTGKSTLGLQYLIAGAELYDEPGVILSFEQVPTQLFADAAALGWDLRALHEAGQVRVVFIEPDDVLANPGRQANRLLVNVLELVEEHGLRRIVIDSISHLGGIFSREEARAGFVKFMLELKGMGLTPLGTAEITPDIGLGGIDAYLVDTLIVLDRHPGARAGHSRRTIEVVKSRGHDHIGGAHPIEITRGGIVVYPHGETAPNTANLPVTPMTTGVAGLDSMLGGGWLPGSVILAAGLSGTFKSVLSGHFLTAAAGAEPPAGMWISFQQSATALARDMAGHGLPVAEAIAGGTLTVLEASPGEPVEKLAARVEALIGQRGLTRVAIDGLNELAGGLAGEDRAEAVRWFLGRLRAHGVTTLVTQRLARVTGRNPLSEIDHAELADTILYLGFVEIESRLEKVLSVLKHRGGPVAGDLRSIRATAQGLQVSDRFLGLSGVLGGQALGHRKAQIEEIFQPLYFLRDFLKLAADPALEPERRARMLTGMTTEADRVIALLSHYFDQQPPAAAPTSKESNR